MKKLSASLFALAFFLTMVLIATQSLASIISTSPSVYKVDTPASVLLHAKESNDQIIIFDELQGFTLTDNVALDITLPGTYTPDSFTPGTASSGTTVDVHLIHFDPVGSPANPIRLQGNVTFGADILGVIVFDSSLYGSDWLGNPNTTYPSVSHGYFTQRGPEFKPQDYLTLSEDMRTLSVDFLTQDKLDEVRIITSPIPLPSAVWLLGSGLIAFAGVRRKLRGGKQTG